MSVLDFIFGKNPADAAKPYFDQIPGQVQGELGPWSDAGKDALGTLQGQYDKLINDPQGFINAIMQGYTQSDAYKANKEDMLGQAANTAAAGGFSGTTTDIRNQGDIVNKLLSQDQQQYLQNILGAYGMGIQGEQGVMGQGYNASSNISDSLANALATQGSLAFQGQAQQNKNRSDLFKGALGALGGIAGLPMAGGGSVGGYLAGKLF